VLTIEFVARRSAGTERFSGDAEIVEALTRFFGSVFQMEEAAAGKARLPTMESLTDGTIRRLVAGEPRALSN